MFTKRYVLLFVGALLCASMALAQAPATVTLLTGDPGPSFSALPPPNPPALDYWNRINGTGAAAVNGFNFPFTATKPYNNYSVNTFVTGGQNSPSFQGGGSKDPNQIGQWKWATTPTPDKDTLTNAYAAAYTGAVAGGHTILNFGADRFSTSGDANIGAWFFQQSVGPVAGGSFSGTHINGDVFLISAFTGGGGTATITVYLWDSGPVGLAGGPSGGCTASNYSTPSSLPACAATNLLEVYNSATVCGNSPTCADTNASPVTVEWNYIAKSNQNGGANIIPTGAFFTGGVDLTYVFQTILGIPVPCLSSFMMDTRSSQSPSAVLKDFIGGNFQLCAIGASAACTTPPTYTVSPAAIHYTVNGSVTNQASGNLFALHVTPGTIPANAVVTQPVTPAGGLANGQSAPFSITFDSASQGAITVTGSACGAPFSGGPCTVVNQNDGTLANWSATVGTGTCSISTNPTMSLAKSCVVTLSQTGSGVVLQLVDTITVKNTDTKDTITNITLTNNVSNGPSADVIVSGLSLAAGEIKTYTPTYTPTACVNGVDPTGGGRCFFQDTVSVTSTPKDEFGNALPSSAIPGSQNAQCAVCPNGACVPPPQP